MNKYLFILGLAGVALFSACSNSDDLSIEDSPAIDEAKKATLIFEAGKNSEVPITLGIGQGRGYTRKPLESGEGGIFSTEAGKYLGVFCLATDYQSPYESNHPIENNWSADDESGLIVRMSNVPAKVEAGVVTFLDSLTLENSTPSEMAYYYPMSNWMKYNFYAYYPRQEETYITASGKYKDALVFKPDQVLEKFYEIDGSQDIIWGMAEPKKAPKVSGIDDADPYSANYFLLKKDSLAVADPEHPEKIAELFPQMTFDHKLVQFRFFVKAADAAALASLQELHAQVTDMKIANAIYGLSLIVANKADPSKNGQLGTYSDNTKPFPIKATGLDSNRFVDSNSDGQVDEPLDITTAEAATVMAGDPIGYIMLAPPSIAADDNFKYQLVVKVNYIKESVPKEKEITIDLDPSVVGLDSFDEGMTYNIVISINSSDLGI